MSSKLYTSKFIHNTTKSWVSVGDSKLLLSHYAPRALNPIVPNSEIPVPPVQDVMFVDFMLFRFLASISTELMGGHLDFPLRLRPEVDRQLVLSSNPVSTQ